MIFERGKREINGYHQDVDLIGIVQENAQTLHLTLNSLLDRAIPLSPTHGIELVVAGSEQAVRQKFYESGAVLTGNNDDLSNLNAAAVDLPDDLLRELTKACSRPLVLKAIITLNELYERTFV